MSVYCSDLPDGKHVAEIIAMKSSKSKKGIPLVEWLLRIIGGEHDGMEVPKRFYFGNDPEKAKRAKDFLHKELKMIGMDVKNGAEFTAQKDQCVGTRIHIEAVTNDEDWQSYYVQGVVKNEEKTEAEDDIGW